MSLGEAQTLRFRFVNYLRKPETYKLALAAGGESDFAVEASVSAPAAEGTQGVEVSVGVTSRTLTLALTLTLTPTLALP